MISKKNDPGSAPSWGASLTPEGDCHWKVWAPRANRVDLVLVNDQSQRSVHSMSPLGDGIYQTVRQGILEGQRYAFCLDGNRELPDPASRWQPDGVHAPSAVWDSARTVWSDSAWTGLPREELVIYELHVGTFTAEGTFAAVIPRLEALRHLGVTAIELMPVAQFPGIRNWGYDGVYWYAVQDSYGGPRELQKLADACHAAGLGIFLDVIYNHLGPEGNYLSCFGPYFTDHHHTPWGAAINYDDRDSEHVRDFVLQNVRYWIRDFHIDGLRLDAVHAIVDSGPRHILADIRTTADDESARRGWPVHIIAESNLNEVRLLLPQDLGGFGLDAQWNDDFHHAVHTCLTGESDGYYADYEPPSSLVKALNDTFVYDGMHSNFLGRKHGAPVGDLPGDRFVVSIQTHDQVGNRSRGDRLANLLQPAQLRLAAAMMLLSPHLPLLFMGEEYGEQHYFPFFCDFEDQSLQEAVRRGRREEFAHFSWGEIPDPVMESTFLSAKLSWEWPEGTWQAGLRSLYQDLLIARRTWPALRDFRSRAAESYLTPSGVLLLRLVRGPADQPRQQVQACFNLTSMVSDLPADWIENKTVLFSTAGTRYGGSKVALSIEDALTPYECCVLQSLENSDYDR